MPAAGETRPGGFASLRSGAEVLAHFQSSRFARGDQCDRTRGRDRAGAEAGAGCGGSLGGRDRTEERGGRVSLPFLLEIGTEEIPDWMIVPALNNLQDMF